MSRGRFISFEGGEGAGKTTQIARLAQALKQRGQRVLLTREPGGAPGAEDIRRLLVEGDPGRWDAMTEALLHVAARRDHLVPYRLAGNVRGECGFYPTVSAIRHWPIKVMAMVCLSTLWSSCIPWLWEISRRI